MAGYYELKRSGEQYLFNLKAGNHETILNRERHTTKASAQAGIESVRLNALHDASYERRSATNGRPYFVLRAASDGVLGTSETYSSTAAMKNGIAPVKRDAPSASATDLP